MPDISAADFDHIVGQDLGLLIRTEAVSRKASSQGPLLDFLSSCRRRYELRGSVILLEISISVAPDAVDLEARSVAKRLREHLLATDIEAILLHRTMMSWSTSFSSSDVEKDCVRA